MRRGFSQSGSAFESVVTFLCRFAMGGIQALAIPAFISRARAVVTTYYEPLAKHLQQSPLRRRFFKNTDDGYHMPFPSFNVPTKLTTVLVFTRDILRLGMLSRNFKVNHR